MQASIEHGKTTAEVQNQIREHICTHYNQDLVWNAVNNEYNRLLKRVKK
jgi:hypothetical protein